MKSSFPSQRKNALRIFAFCLLPFAFCLLSASAQSPGFHNCIPFRPIPIDRWRGEYFNNTNLSGAPAMIRDDTQFGSRFLELDWKLNSPEKDCGIGVDNFSARWTRTIAFGSGSYRFKINSDDGVRLLVDGQLRLDQWNDHALATNTTDVLLTAGNHKLELQYYERWGSASVSLSWEKTPCTATVAPDHWRGEYFNNDNLSGESAVVRDDGNETIYFDWRDRSPDQICGVNAGKFSARWSRRVAFGSGLYRFDVVAGGGARVFVDGELRLDEWNNAATFIKTFDLQLNGGNHQVVFEYRKAGQRAGAGLSWKTIPCFENVPGNHWRGEYFNNDNLTGSAVMVRDDGDAFRHIDFNWGEASPAAACGVRNDNFSARWAGEQIFYAGNYLFTVSGNGALRFYVDGKLLLDKWDQRAGKHTLNVELSAGNHRLVLEYAEFGGRAAVSLSWQSPPCIAAVSAERWRAEYFSNRELAGRPIVVRDEGDGQLNHDWGLDRPHGDCFEARDDFSARWSRTVNFAAGTYRFTVTADDGVRLYVDGKRLIDQWRDQSAKTFSADVGLTNGAHRISMEYYEAGGSALAKLSWAVAPCSAIVPAERWRAEYFNNTDLIGKPALVRDEGDGALNFDWGLKSPDGNCGVNVDNFSARLTRNVTFGEGVFRFTVTADDGVRVFVDDQLKFDRWREQMMTDSFDVALTAGNHQIRVEYFERWGSAAMKLRWEQHPCFATVANDHWRGEYFNNDSLNGQPAMVRDDGDGAIDFDWKLKGPSANCGISSDNFSVRWTRRLILEAGTYRFTATGDDGVRLFINGKKLIDEWRDQSPTTFAREVILPAGSHRITFEYYDRAGGATAKLSWQKTAQRREQQ
ncbi:MAG: PA14 domain-containing protein [Blastocatellales bacterium]